MVDTCHYVYMLSHFSHVWFFATPWTVARQAPLSMGFSREGYWSGLPCPSPRDLFHPGTEPATPVSQALQADLLPSEPPGKSTCHYAFVQIHRMYTIKSEPQCKLWIWVIRMYPWKFISGHRHSTLVTMLMMEEAVLVWEISVPSVQFFVNLKLL